MGFSLIYFIGIVLSWVILFIRSSESPRWAKLLLAYCTLYIGFIYFGRLGYYPDFINKLQFPRAVPFIALVLPFCFAAFLQAAFSGARSRMFYTILIAVLAIGTTESIEIASQYTAQPISQIHDPVAEFFSDKEVPKGSIYIKEVPSASYFGKPGLRFVTSYNRFPNPYPVRFNALMKTDVSYTGVTNRQIELIKDYSLVIGVEYLFTPKLSPLVDGLTQQGGVDSKPTFEVVGEVQPEKETISVLRNREDVALAYAFEARDTEQLLRFNELPKSSAKAASFKAWDEEMSRFAQEIREKKLLKPIPVRFEWPDTIVLDTSTGALEGLEDPNIIVMQSYDHGWTVKNMNDISIAPTNLRFMYLKPTNESFKNADQVVLQNHWPLWHWPIQSTGLVMVILTGIYVALSQKSKELEEVV